MSRQKSRASRASRSAQRQRLPLERAQGATTPEPVTADALHPAATMRTAPPRAATRPATLPQRRTSPAYRHTWRPGKLVLTLVGAVVVLAVVYLFSNASRFSLGSASAGQAQYAVGSPGVGAVAPGFTLPSTTGGTVSLSGLRGKTVLLYFQEGIGCEGCWTQLKDIQTDMSPFRGLGIDAVVTVTTNPLDALKQKVTDEGISLPVLADTSTNVSRAYGAMAYGMMAGAADGHTFILVGPDGRIRWRADYGGPPNYTMYVPLSQLIADLRKGERNG
ncbi:MAG TPA: redoxin domain-containing protein [Ktedonobacterales bacterium]|nr:redoxin domain-containing protein [Ktedonobacterales bacterium]